MCVWREQDDELSCKENPGVPACLALTWRETAQANCAPLRPHLFSPHPCIHLCEPSFWGSDEIQEMGLMSVSILGQ